MTRIAGYADRVSVTPGETIDFMVSSEAPSYKCDIVRIICGDENPDGPGVKEEVVRTAASGTYKGRKQVCHDGSFLEVPSHPEIQGLESFTFQAFVWPTTPDRGTQALIANWRDRDKAGAALIITKQDGSLALCLGDGKGGIETIATRRPLLPHQWYFVAASYDAGTKQVTLVQQPLNEYPTVNHGRTLKKKSTLDGPGQHDAPLTMGAYFRRVDKGRTVCGGFYNGRIDSPRVANRVLTPAEMELAKTRPTEGALAAAIVGAWDFSRGITTTAATDLSANALHGSLVNLPTRAVTGWCWDGSEMNWRNAPAQYGAIHFHEDDLYDARWEVDFSLTVPKRLKSGVYAARLRGGGAEEYIPFAISGAARRTGRQDLLPAAHRELHGLRQHQHVDQHGRGADPHRPAHDPQREEPAASRAPGIRHLALRQPHRRQRGLLLLAAQAGPELPPEGAGMDRRHRIHALAVQRRHPPHRVAGRARLRLRRGHRRGPAL